MTTSARRQSHAILVAAGILASRLVGFIRQRTMNHFFGGRSDAADAFYAAFKIPNLLQNLFGEGALSGSFIPVYSRLLAEGNEKEAAITARAVLGVLIAVVAVLVALGITITPVIISFIAPGFEGEKRALTIWLVRILFPGSGILVISAWCLGVLNSHRRFFLSYSAPVIWNLCIIGALLIGADWSDTNLAVIAAWGAVVGGVAQVLVQLPAVRSILPSLRPTFSFSSNHVRTVCRHFIPTAAVRGVAQVSAYIDQMIASLLPTGAITGLTNAQLIYTLPVSLFGMSIAASELPELSRMAEGATHAIERRLITGFRQLSFTVIPTVVAFLLIGDIIVGAIYQSGAFSTQDVRYVWAILCGSAIGLLAGTQGRLLSSTFYALQDPRTPLRYAAIRVFIASIVGLFCAVEGPQLLGVAPLWGAVGLSAASGCAAWIEFLLLRAHLSKHRDITPRIERQFLALITLSSLLSGATCFALKGVCGALHPIFAAAVILPLFGGLYLGITIVLKIPEASVSLMRVTNLLNRVLQRRSA